MGIMPTAAQRAESLRMTRFVKRGRYFGAAVGASAGIGIARGVHNRRKQSSARQTGYYQR